MNVLLPPTKLLLLALMKQVGEISSGHEEKRKMALEELQAKLPNMCSDQRKTVLVALAHAVLRGDGIIRLEEWKDQQLWDDGTGLAAVFRAALLVRSLCLQFRCHRSHAHSFLGASPKMGTVRWETFRSRSTTGKRWPGNLHSRYLELDAYLW